MLCRKILLGGASPSDRLGRWLSTTGQPTLSSHSIGHHHWMKTFLIGIYPFHSYANYVKVLMCKRLRQRWPCKAAKQPVRQCRCWTFLYGSAHSDRHHRPTPLPSRRCSHRYLYHRTHRAASLAGDQYALSMQTMNDTGSVNCKSR